MTTDRLTWLVQETKRLKAEAATLRDRLAQLEHQMQAMNTEMLGIMQARNLRNVTIEDGTQAYITHKLTCSVRDPLALLRWAAETGNLSAVSPRIVASRIVDDDGELVVHPEGVDIQRFYRVAIRNK